jgi:hypothetical protein
MANNLVEIHPTGTYPDDIDNVRQAIDAVADGGTVLLKAKDASGIPRCFHFGDDTKGRDGINIRKNVTILGETLKKNEQTVELPPDRTGDAAHPMDRTVIYGGHRPFYCGDLESAAIALNVRQLYFAFPSQSAVQVKRSSGLEVSNCVIDGLKKDEVRDVNGNFEVAVGIEATGHNQSAGSIVLVGDFKVFDNIVDRLADGQYGAADTGIAVQYARMNADIHGNKVSNFAFVGIGIDANEGTATVSKNDIFHCGYGIETRPDQPTAAIGVRRISGLAGNTTITNNRLTCGVGPAGRASRNGISLIGASEVSVRSNRITGTASANGILLTTYASGQPTQQHSRNNSIEDNDLKKLVAGRAQESIDKDCVSNTSTGNKFGALDPGPSRVAGIVIDSNDNMIADEHFFGDYPGTSVMPPIPCVLLGAGTSGNTVGEIHLSQAGAPFNAATQVQDNGSNTVGELKKSTPGKGKK